jgi:hypothetical protein
MYEIIEDTQLDTKFIKHTDENGNERFIPFDEGNADYQAYLAATGK